MGKLTKDVPRMKLHTCLTSHSLKREGEGGGEGEREREREREGGERERERERVCVCVCIYSLQVRTYMYMYLGFIHTLSSIMYCVLNIFKNEQKVGMLLQKRTDTRGVGISSMRKSIYLLTTTPSSHTHTFPPLSTIVIHTLNLCKVKSMDDNCGEWVECMGVFSGCG